MVYHRGNRENAVARIYYIALEQRASNRAPISLTAWRHLRGSESASVIVTSENSYHHRQPYSARRARPAASIFRVARKCISPTWQTRRERRP